MNTFTHFTSQLLSIFTKTRIPFSVILLMGLGFWESQLLASHNLAGQISVIHEENNSYQIKLTTFTDPAPQGVDRCSATLEIWSIGVSPTLIATLESIPRANGPIVNVDPLDCPDISSPRNGVPVYNTIKYNLYEASYTFPEPGRYEIRYYDVARREDVINMEEPGTTAFYVSSQIVVMTPEEGVNSLPVLLNDPVDEACAGVVYSHNPGGFDPDGDSLVYKLQASQQYEPPTGINPQEVNGYSFPDDEQFGNGPLTMDPNTGLITWETPETFGVYNITYVVEDYRNGILLGQVVRDMVIIVNSCQNNPPELITNIDELCIEAGQTLKLELLAFDPNPEDSLYLMVNNGRSGLNGPFGENVTNKASIKGMIIDPVQGNKTWTEVPVSTENNAINGSNTIDTLMGEISWTPTCSDIRSQPYQIDLFVHDNDSYIANPANVRLVNNLVVRVRVLPPTPKNLNISSTPTENTLSWDIPDCGEVMGYHVYRKLGTGAYDPACQSSPADAGYEFHSCISGRESNTYVDTSLGQAIEFSDYSYVLIAVYQYSNSPDAPICQTTSNDQPLLEKNDIRIFPNPTEETTTILLNMEFTGVVELELYDLTGRKLYSRETFKPRLLEVHQHSIDLSKLTRGTYIVRVKAEGIEWERLVQKR